MQVWSASRKDFSRQKYLDSEKSTDLTTPSRRFSLGFFRSSRLPNGEKGGASRSGEERAVEAEAGGRGGNGIRNGLRSIPLRTAFWE